MMISLRRRYKEGDRVRFRNGSVCVPAQWIPPALAGTVIESYLKPYGMSMREELCVAFEVPDQTTPTREIFTTTLRDLPADQMEPAL